jgi:hypothetical protein
LAAAVLALLERIFLAPVVAVLLSVLSLVLVVVVAVMAVEIAPTLISRWRRVELAAVVVLVLLAHLVLSLYSVQVISAITVGIRVGLAAVAEAVRQQ